MGTGSTVYVPANLMDSSGEYFQSTAHAPFRKSVSVHNPIGVDSENIPTKNMPSNTKNGLSGGPGLGMRGFQKMSGGPG